MSIRAWQPKEFTNSVRRNDTFLPQLNMQGIKAALIENYSVKSAAKKTKEIYESLIKASS